MFSHLHTHSYFSFLEGLTSPAGLANAAARSGMPAMALTDSGGMTGAVEFYDACLAAGVQPVLGLEVQAAASPGLFESAKARIDHLAARPYSAGKLVLLAMDMTGWGNLCRLSSACQGSPVLSHAQLAEHSAGLICLSGGAGGLSARCLQDELPDAARMYLNELASAFPDRLYVELQLQAAGDLAWVNPLAGLAAGLRLPVVATHEIYYLTPEEADLQRLVAAIRTNQRVDKLPPGVATRPGAYFASPDEMRARFSRFPQALQATQEISERCRLELPLRQPHFPSLDHEYIGQSPMQVLRQKAQAGVQKRYGQVTAEVQRRLDHELAVIEECGYAALFLIMEEILTFARRSGVPVSSRGSAASSLVAHALGITSPDPVRLNLYFERFLNPARATPPDIDTDLCSRRREDVIRFVYERYGEDRVATVCTIQRFRPRSALREAAKAHGFSTQEISAMARELPYRWWRQPAAEEEEDESQRDVPNSYSPNSYSPNPHSPYAPLFASFSSPRHRALFQDAAALLDKPQHLSVHPGGIVIAPGPLNDLVPTQTATKGVTITQLDLESIERLGLVKIDLLGIRGLTVLGDVAETVRVRQPERYSSNLDVLEAIPTDDPATAELIRTGRTVGCFQIESPGMQATLREIQAHSIEDVMVALALYRPGPLTGGLKDAFVRRHRHLEAVNHLHPALAPLLEDTYGVILYQEQVLRIAHELAGLSLADADLLRRAMSHFDPGKQMQTLKEKFIAGAAAHSRVPPATAERVWDLMAAFAGYGFPKAHAASYAVVGWRAAWCKAHHPAEFMAAVLANWGGYYPQRTYLREARRLGLTVRPPHINYARPEFSVCYLEGQPVLFMGLNQVRELTRRTQARIQQERPFRSLADFLRRADPRPVEAENLVKCGALEGLGDVPALLRGLKGQPSSRDHNRGQLSFFELGLEEAPVAGDRSTVWTLEQVLEAEQSILGGSVSAHPLELYTGQIARAGAITTREAAALVGRQVRVAGMRQSLGRTRTARGGLLYFLSLEDLEGTLDVLIFGDVYRASRQALDGPGPYLIEGVVEMDAARGEPVIRAERVSKLG